MLLDHSSPQLYSAIPVRAIFRQSANIDPTFPGLAGVERFAHPSRFVPPHVSQTRARVGRCVERFFPWTLSLDCGKPLCIGDTNISIQRTGIEPISRVILGR